LYLLASPCDPAEDEDPTIPILLELSMDDDLPISFTLPNFPRGRRVTAREAEVLIRSKISEKKREYEDAVWELVRFYSTTGRINKASELIEELMESVDDPERAASYWLALGQLAERREDFNAAISIYSRGLSMEPASPETWYLLNNNIGYSLIQMGRYEEAEVYCRAAIEIDRNRHNAYKNLGLSLEGQDKYQEACIALMQATRVNAVDPRAFKHLESLISQHPDLLDIVPELSAFLDKGKTAIDMAGELTVRFQEIQQNESPELTGPERIAIAVALLMQEADVITFTRDDVRRALGVSRETWMASLTSIFQAMREDEPGGAPKINPRYRGLFRRVSHGNYVLTDRGARVIMRIHSI
jgi:tetratricopeptide (TPR) repeat protein